jgi:hypothetical protein
MFLRLLSPSLTAFTLAMGLLGCSGKDNPSPDTTPPAAGMGRYTLDGKVIQCDASLTNQSRGGEDYLLIFLTSKTPPTNGYEYVRITYKKAQTQAVGSFRAASIEYESDGKYYTFSTAPSTLDLTTSGGFSGKVSASASSAGHTFSDGIFTDVRP